MRRNRIAVGARWILRRRAASFRLLFSFLALVALAGAAEVAWGCPSCKEAILESGSASASASLAKGYARSILLLMAVPYALFAGVSYCVVRAARRNRSKDPSASSPCP
jgi:hypothetical protein